MRHRKSGLKLNRTASHRDAMFRNMVTSLFKHQRIKTTDAKAKELRRWADRLITLAKRGDLHARRQALAIVREKDVVHKLFEDAPSRFANTSGGYTRVIKIGRRAGDAAPVSIVEIVSPAPVTVKTKKKPAKKKKTPTPSKAKATKSETKADKTAAESAEESQDQETADLTPESMEEVKVTGAGEPAEAKEAPAAPEEDTAPDKDK